MQGGRHHRDEYDEQTSYELVGHGLDDELTSFERQGLLGDGSIKEKEKTYSTTRRCLLILCALVAGGLLAYYFSLPPMQLSRRAGRGVGRAHERPQVGAYARRRARRKQGTAPRAPCASIFYCPRSRTVPQLSFDVPALHPLAAPCDTSWRAIVAPAGAHGRSAHASQAGWHAALTRAARAGGRSLLSRHELQRACQFFGAWSASDPLNPGGACYGLHRWYLLLAHILANEPPPTDGLWLEFGVFTGTSLNMSADAKAKLLGQSQRLHPSRPLVHGFDSFHGLPTNLTIVHRELGAREHRLVPRETRSFTKQLHARPCHCGWTKGGSRCGKGDGSRCWVVCCGGAGAATARVDAVGGVRGVHAATTPTTSSSVSGSTSSSSDGGGLGGGGSIIRAKTTTIRAGAFSLGGVRPPVRPTAALHKGLFRATLPPFLARQATAERVHYVNLDMDLYDGAYTVLVALTPRLTGGDRAAGGTLLHFHELLHFTEDGAASDTALNAKSGQAPPASAIMMDEARALYDWLHGAGTSSSSNRVSSGVNESRDAGRLATRAHPAVEMAAIQTRGSCVALEMVPRQARRRDGAVAFRVLQV